MLFWRGRFASSSEGGKVIKFKGKSQKLVAIVVNPERAVTAGLLKSLSSLSLSIYLEG
jgi:hypothetical protein